MPILRQAKDIRNSEDIKELCAKNNPVFITKNGEVTYVAISTELFEEYENIKARAELRAQLAVAEAESRAGAPRIAHADLMAKIREKIHGSKI